MIRKGFVKSLSQGFFNKKPEQPANLPPINTKPKNKSYLVKEVL